MDTEPDASLVGGDVLHLREAFDNDIPLLLQLIRAAFEEYRDKLDPPSGVFIETEQSLRALLTREHAVLATLNGVPVGSIFYDVRQTEFYVHRLAVRQEYRRHGIGAALLNHVEAITRTAGRAVVTLSLRTALSENRHFYERRGYRVTGFDCHPGYTTFTMVRMAKCIGPQPPRPIIVVPYDVHWSQDFSYAAAEISSVYREQLVSIHHIGSTAIRGVAAKPTIDIMPVVRDIERVNEFDPVMLAFGFWPQGENGVPGRRYFRKGDISSHTHHVHVYQEGHPAIERHLALVAYLNRHPEDAHAYGELKMALARRYSTDVDGYMAGKDGYVKWLESRALAWMQTTRQSY